jgi:hypothetical protein
MTYFATCVETNAAEVARFPNSFLPEQRNLGRLRYFSEER